MRVTENRKKKLSKAKTKTNQKIAELSKANIKNQKKVNTAAVCKRTSGINQPKKH